MRILFLRNSSVILGFLIALGAYFGATSVVHASITLSGSAQSQSQVYLSWVDTAAAPSFTVYRDGGSIGTAVDTDNFTNTGRECGTEYAYYIRSVFGVNSNTVYVTTDECTPATPTGVTASALNQSEIQYTWSDNSSNESGFQIFDGNVDYIIRATVGPNVTWYSDYFSCGVWAAQYMVRAYVSTNGRTYYSNWSAYSNAVQTDACTPGTPSGATLSATGQSSFHISWTRNSPYTDSGFEVRTGGSFDVVKATAGAGATSVDFTDLWCGATARYDVLAYVVSNGRYYYSGRTTSNYATLYACAPTAPSNVSASPINQSEIQYTWSDNSSNETEFQIFDGNGEGTIRATVGPNVTWYSDYFSCGVWAAQYMVRACASGACSSWSSYSNAIQTDACTPGAPSSVSLSPTSQSAFSLSWTRNSPYTESNFGIFHDAGGGATEPEPDFWASAGATSYTISGLSCGSTMRYLVNSHLIGASGNIYWGGGNWSGWATTDACAPTAPSNLSASAVSASQVDLSWSDASGESGYDVYRCLTSSCSYSYIGYATANSSWYSDSGLSASTGYTYRIRSYVYTNGRYYYSAYSNTAAATTLSSNGAPTCSVLNPAAVNEGQAINLTQSCSDPNGDSLTYSWWNNTTCNSSAIATGPTWSVTQNEPMTGTFYSYRAYDGSANSNCALVNNSTWINVPPSVTATNNGPTTAGSPITFTANATDPGGTTFSYQWYSDAACTSPISGATSVTRQETLAVAGTLTRYARACDAQSSCTCSAGSTGTWTLSGSAPTCNALSPAAVNEAQSITFTQSCSDPNGDPLTYSWWNNGTCNGTQTASGGSWGPITQNDPVTASYSYRAWDGSYNSSCTGISATWINVAPSVSVTNNGPAVDGAPITFTANASDPGGTTFSYQWYTDACTTPIAGATGVTRVETSGGSTSTAWYNASWLYRKTITIDNTKVAETLTNFPVLVAVTSTDLRYTASGGHVASSLGYDILITSSDGVTKLPHEIEKYTSATGELVAWVNVPSLSSAAPTVLYLYYGNAAATNQQQVASTWNSGFKGVWHLGEGAGTASLDSTINANNGTLANITWPTGRIGRATGFNDSSSENDLGSRSALSVTTGLTVSCWVNSTANETDYSRCFTHAPLSYDPWGEYALSLVGTGVGAPSSNYVRFEVETGGSLAYFDSASAISSGAWHQIAGTWDGSMLRIYIDGAYSSQMSKSGTVTNYNNNNQIGFNKDESGGKSGYFYGGIDEVRVSNAARSAGWLLTEYNNQSNPGTFESFGTEEVPPTGGASSVTRYVRACDAQSSCTCSAGSTGYWNSSIAAPSAISSLTGIQVRGWNQSYLTWSGTANGFLVFRRGSTQATTSYALYANNGSANATVGNLTCPGSYIFKVVSYNTDASVTGVDATCSLAGATSTIGIRCGTLVETGAVKITSCSEHLF